jgi:hypothetical protein
VNNTPHDEELANIGTVKPSDKAIEEIEKVVKYLDELCFTDFDYKTCNSSILRLKQAIDYLK